MSLSLPLSSRVKASLRAPREITSYSIDINNKVQLDDSSLKYYYLPESQVNEQLQLHAGYKKFIRKDESQPQHLNTLLTALIDYEKKAQKKVKADIITWRGIMTKLLCLPFEKGDDIDLNLLYFDNQIFIEEDFETVNSKRRPMDERGELLTFGGYKFETLATLDAPWARVSRKEIESRSDKPVNNIEQYVSVVRTGVGKVKVVFGGEVDCVKDFKPNSELMKKPLTNDDDEKIKSLSSKSSPLSHYVELKTSRYINSTQDAVKFEKKIFKAWAQSFLIGVPTIIYGFRDDQGNLKSVEEFETENIPTIIKNSPITQKHQKWNGVEAIAFYGAVLDWIKANINQEGIIYRLTYKAGSPQLQLTTLPNYQTFLSEEFINWRKSSELNSE